jgi:hypothetical protein
MRSTALEGRTDMAHFEYGSGAISRSYRIPVLFTCGLLLALAFAGNALGAPPVPLGDAATFGALSSAGMTNNGLNTVVNGDIGSSTSIDVGVTNPGFARYGPSTQLTNAQASLVTAYDNARLASPDHSITGSNLAGQTLFPGVYKSTSSILIDGPLALTLDGNGDPNSVFIFQAGSDLTVNPTSSITLTNGAQACNVFWQVTSSAALKNTGFKFVGTILALTSITLTEGITVDGRVLARNAAVTFIHDTVNTPSCASTGSAGITLTPKTALNTVGVDTSHTVTAHFTVGGVAQSGVVVTFTVTAGPNTGQTGTGTTDVNGNASFTYTSNGGVGIDTITASAPGTNGVLTTVSDTAQKVWLQAGVPICALTAVIGGPPKQIQVTVQDLSSGLGSIQVTTSTNATTVVPGFTPGTNSAVVVTATKIDQTTGSRIALTVTSVAGVVTTCDPVWPGKAAKPTSRVKHLRVGRGAAGWGRRTT